MHDLILVAVLIGLIILYVRGLKAQDEREYQEDRIRKGYRDDD